MQQEPTDFLQSAVESSVHILLNRRITLH